MDNEVDERAKMTKVDEDDGREGDLLVMELGKEVKKKG